MSNKVEITTFFADAALFDMDGTLTDSIAAVEAAWGKVALDIGEDPAHVIAATHGKRAVDNLAQFKAHIKAHEMDAEVQAFEESILFFADAFNKHGPSSREVSPISSGVATPALASSDSGSSSEASSRSSSFAGTVAPRPSFVRHVTDRLAEIVVEGAIDDEVFVEDGEEMDWRAALTEKHKFEAWQIEAAAVDRSVRILPGVKRLMDSIPKGRYAVATSGARTYAYGCMTRVGIAPPEVTITACDKRLKAGKPAPDPFLLAAKELGFSARQCVVFEDSPSGIRAGAASGAIVIAVCTSHERSKIVNCGAHFIVDTLEQVRVVFDGIDLRFTVTERKPL
ncbi:HAD-like protein [Dichomitus squalens]|uniref:HAD-like protein n=1 Tax=Dichomitus squalens TaxID=114155 RepID=A0A4Q9NWC3_9APHY|nr:HAD-like protein [Dichomitus squalens]TBU54634.1 HAD-like protein [Dichomitus squalens]